MVSRVRIKSIVSPLATVCPVMAYGYDVDTAIACVKRVVELHLMVKVAPAGEVYNNAVPEMATVPAAGAVHRTTAPRVAYDGYPCINPLSHTARYNSLPSHFDAPVLYVSKSPLVSRYDHESCPCTPLNCDVYVYVVGVPPPPPEPDDTVTALVFVTPLSDALMVVDPAATPVTVKFVLAFPGDTTALAPTVATAGEEDASVNVVLDVTAPLMVAEKSCVFPGDIVTAAGVRELNTGTPPDDATDALTYK
jgi:hypothetical protein